MPTRSQAINRVLSITLILNLAVAAAKILLGLMTGALAISADGLHSIVDSSGNVTGLIATRMAAAPPDDDHPYGHSRYESLAALAIGVLLLFTAFEIAQGAIERLHSGSQPNLTPLAFGVMLATLVINILVNRYQVREGKRLDSEILLADAANTGSDVLVTLSVLGSMALTALLGWGWIDVAAAFFVTVLIGRAAFKILSRTGRVLVDTAPFAPEVLEAAVREIPAVEDVLRVRSRGSNGEALVDIDLSVNPTMTAEESAALALSVRSRLQSEMPGIREVEVHFAPGYAQQPDYAQSARVQAVPLALSAHEVVVSDSPDGKVVEMHVEVPANQRLVDAHARVSQLEQAVKQNLPDVVEVITHIEPALQATPIPAQGSPQTQQVEARVRDLLHHHYPNSGWHHLYVHPLERGYATSMHLTLSPDLSVEAAHHIAEQMELQIRSAIPSVERVTIHTEPPDTQPL